jgi:hypothetical protein
VLRVWVARAHAGERYAQVVVPRLSENASAGAFRVRGVMVDEPRSLTVKKTLTFGLLSFPAWVDDGEGVAIGIAVSQNNVRSNSTPPAGWWAIDYLQTSGISLEVFGFTLTGSGAQAAATWGSSTGDGVLALMLLHRVGHHLYSSGLFDETAGIPAVGGQIVEPVDGARPAADEPGFPLPPTPRPIVVPTEAHRLGRYPT